MHDQVSGGMKKLHIIFRKMWYYLWYLHEMKDSKFACSWPLAIYTRQWG